METLAIINHNNEEGRRINLEIDENGSLWTAGEQLDAPKFETEEEAIDYIQQAWKGQVWELEIV